MIPWLHDEDTEYELTAHEAVCESCHLVRNKHTEGCGNCFDGRSVHEKRQHD